MTLTRASNVAFLDLEWSPAMHDQAEDRRHRIGQRDAVTAWYLLAAETIDESMAEVLARKRGHRRRRHRRPPRRVRGRRPVGGQGAAGQAAAPPARGGVGPAARRRSAPSPPSTSAAPASSDVPGASPSQSQAAAIPATGTSSVNGAT